MTLIATYIAFACVFLLIAASSTTLFSTSATTQAVKKVQHSFEPIPWYEMNKKQNLNAEAVTIFNSLIVELHASETTVDDLAFGTSFGGYLFYLVQTTDNQWTPYNFYQISDETNNRFYFSERNSEKILLISKERFEQIYPYIYPYSDMYFQLTTPMKYIILLCLYALYLWIVKRLSPTHRKLKFNFHLLWQFPLRFGISIVTIFAFALILQTLNIITLLIFFTLGLSIRAFIDNYDNLQRNWWELPFSVAYYVFSYVLIFGSF